MAEQAATRSAALALADERTLMRQGYQFLDEKRMLLAGEILRRVREHEALAAEATEAAAGARSALGDALQRHGLAGLRAYPPLPFSPEAPEIESAAFLGVATLSARWPARVVAAPEPALDASPEARRCRDAFVTMLEPLVRLAASATSLERLVAEYRRTERRARALENVLLPEVDQALRTIEERLELADQEEAVRTRLAARGRQESGV
ncbi:MAG: V-type ATP synthase subunit D [Burkholderiaceae bacterium]|nr:V-type ATP synthase subunit D [Burkholderiaceae bacterium]